MTQSYAAPSTSSNSLRARLVMPRKRTPSTSTRPAATPATAPHPSPSSPAAPPAAPPRPTRARSRARRTRGDRESLAIRHLRARLGDGLENFAGRAMPQKANTRAAGEPAVRHQARFAAPAAAKRRRRAGRGRHRSAPPPGTAKQRHRPLSRNGPAGMHPAVAEPGRAVHHQQRQVFARVGILQPVIHDQRLAPPHATACAGGRRGRAASRSAPLRASSSASSPTSAAACRRPVDPHHAADPAAIAAGQAMHRTPRAGSRGAESSATVVLPAPAHAGIAAAQHRHRRPPARPRQRAAPSRRLPQRRAARAGAAGARHAARTPARASSPPATRAAAPPPGPAARSSPHRPALRRVPRPAPAGPGCRSIAHPGCQRRLRPPPGATRPPRAAAPRRRSKLPV